MSAESHPPQITVRIPAQIRRVYETSSRETLQAQNITALVRELDARYPGIGERLMEPTGSVRRWVNIFVDGEDVRALDGANTTLHPGSEVSIVPSVAGG
jgi:molybdopterin synthase sulfur carrier subunit